MNNLVTRALSGAVFITVVMSSILLKQYPYYFGIVFGGMCALGLREFYLLSKQIEGVEPAWVLAMFGGIAAFLCAFSSCEEENPYAIAILAAYIPFVTAQLVVELYRQKKNPIHNIAVALMGHLYVALPFCCMCAIEGFGPIYLLAFFVLIWASDTGAYLVGMCIGKHKMFERVSPKKTWEGFFGGLGFALIFGFLFSKFGHLVAGDTKVALNIWMWLLFAVLVFITGTLGDLVESLFKRYLQIKDSGKFLPGHGGVLDRLDSALLASPIAFSFLAIVLFLNN